MKNMKRSPENVVIYPRNQRAAENGGFSQEQLEIIDVQLELAIVKFSRKINEGNNGVIFKLDLHDAKGAADLLRMIEDKRTEQEKKETVVKILKVYRPGAGKREFEMQRKAFEIVKGAGDKELAEVPEPILFRELNLSEEAQDYLRSRGMNCGEKAEVIVMDFVEGVDLATYLYREVIKVHPKTRHLADRVEELGFAELHEEVTQALSFRVPGGKARSDEERAFERERVESENAELLFRFLERRGFQMDSRIPARIKATMDVFHENGFAFRDGHHRNFMFAGEGKDLRVHIVDYGSSTTFEGPLTDEVYAESEKRYPKDDTVVRTIERFTKTADMVDAEKRVAFEKEMQGLRRRLANREAEWQTLLIDVGQVAPDLAAAQEKVSGWNVLRGQAIDMKTKVFCLALYELVVSGKLDKGLLRENIKRFLNTAGPTPVLVRELTGLYKVFE